MINARDLLPMSWIANAKGYNARVTTCVPRYGRTPETAHLFEWIINGEDEGYWSGIPLTPEMLRRNKWQRWKDDDHMQSYVLLYDFYCTFIKNDDGVFKAGAIVVNDEMRVIQFVHELQLQYFAKVGKHLNFDL